MSEEQIEIVEESDAADVEITPRKKSNGPWVITGAIIAILGLFAVAWILSQRSDESVSVKVDNGEPAGHSDDEKPGTEVRLDAELLESAAIETEYVTQRPAISKLYVTGAVELNPERTGMATPLVGGRMERVFFGVGDNVSKGAVLAVISSPQLAQMHGKMHEAKTRYELALRNLARVQRSENRVAVTQAKARLDEAEATLKRTRRLIELGAGAGKDLIAADTNQKTAKAEYEFQSNITLNKELQEAKAEVETSRVDLRHIEDEMRSLGVRTVTGSDDDHRRDTSLVNVVAPLSGTITERKFNAGAGVEASTPIFTIANTGSVYVIANVPELSLRKLNIGAVAEIRSPSIGSLNGRISYIDPQLDETTRTGRVRVEVSNLDGKLRGGMFAEVGFYAGTVSTTGQELAVRTEAIQREGDRNIVFIPKADEAGSFEVREVELGGETEGYTTVVRGLVIGEKVVTKGSFVLKAQMQKGELGEHGH